MYDVVADFKSRAMELLDPDNDYWGGVYIMNLSREAGLGVVKLRTGDCMMDVLAESVAPFTVSAVAVAFLGVELGPVDGKLAVRDRGLILIGVDSENRFFGWKCGFKAEYRSTASQGTVVRVLCGSWSDVGTQFKDSEEQKLLMEIKRDSSFDLSAAEAVPGRVLAGVTII